jgi:hypothetical protein
MDKPASPTKNWVLSCIMVLLHKRMHCVVNYGMTRTISKNRVRHHFLMIFWPVSTILTIGGRNTRGSKSHCFHRVYFVNSETHLSTDILRPFCLERPVDKRLSNSIQLQSGKHPDGAEVPVRMFLSHSSANPHHATKHGDYRAQTLPLPQRLGGGNCREQLSH